MQLVRNAQCPRIYLLFIQVFYLGLICWPLFVYLLCLLELGYLGERQGERIGRHVAITPL